MRTSYKSRKTFETDIELKLNIDGKGISLISTGIGFLNHMLTLFSKHGLFDLNIESKGDIEVDYHHSVEDIGIVLGKAFKEALGQKDGIRRYAHVYTPMDESLSFIAIDISGRPHLSFEAEFTREKIGQFDTELVEEFFRGFVNGSEITLHIKILNGKNHHHMVESIFKGFGRALDQATLLDERITGPMSTKGVL